MFSMVTKLYKVCAHSFTRSLFAFGSNSLLCIRAYLFSFLLLALDTLSRLIRHINLVRLSCHLIYSHTFHFVFFCDIRIVICFYFFCFSSIFKAFSPMKIVHSIFLLFFCMYFFLFKPKTHTYIYRLSL